MRSSDWNDSPVTENEDIYSVSEIAEALRHNLETEFPSVRIIGEIANFKAHASGHYYLTLRDEKNLIRIVIFKRNAYRLPFLPSDGMQVIASGRISFYGGTGQTQLIAENLVRAGKGASELQFRRTLQKLIDEGATGIDRKRAIPRFPEKIAVITSLSGAVIKDISNTLARRWPLARIVRVPAEVQGATAAGSIIRAFEETDSMEGIDCVILARGGGSIEDLWAFNLEETARAVLGSKYPVITGIGHEIDTTICDYVSDLRAPTPTAAAELAAPEIGQVKNDIANIIRILGKIADRGSLRRYNMLDLVMRSSVFPAIRHRLDYGMLQADEKQVRLENWWKGNRHDLLASSGNLCVRLDRTLIDRLGFVKEKTAARIRMLEGLYPLSILKRGYSFCTSDDGLRIISGTDNIGKGDNIAVNFHDGSAFCTVKDKRKGKMWRQNKASKIQ
ncbi:MAG: exodeoxyribonuclease VII large subunit [Candidatus Krumholzibacteriota bacterium]|nr:exodeoxyribonuclease VII large subunit [Candidatus Krumholzibacteriota bacterium]